jgi:hypothetical protein
MVRLVEPPAVEVVAEALDDGETELPSAPPPETSRAGSCRPPTACSAMARTIGTRAARSSLNSASTDGRRHALVGAVDQRIGDVLVGREKVGVSAAEVECLFEHRTHGGKIVGRARARPGIVGGGAEGAPAGDELGRHLGRPVEVATHDTDETRIVAVVGQALGMRCKVVEQLAESWVGEFLVRQPAQGRALPGRARPAPPLGMYVAWSQPSTAPAPVKSPISSSRRLSSASLASADGRLRSRFAGSVLAFFAELLVVVLALRLAVVVEGMGDSCSPKRAEP